MDSQKNMESEGIVHISEGGLEYSIYLPDRGVDYIQTYIFNQKLPYERDMLINMCSHLQKGEIVLDIGANVGNHTLYLAGVGQAKVLAFEPNRHLADAIRRSVQLSGLEDAVTVLNIGLGKISAHAHFEKDIPENLGAQKLEVGDGELEIARLDDQKIPSPVKIIKIDVEGMELDVLEGGRNLILRDRPLLYIESATEASYRQISTYLAELGYGYWEGFNATPTHCFRPLASISLNEQVERLIQREVFQEYRLREQLRLAYRAQNDAVAKTRGLEQQVGKLSADLASRDEQLQEAKNALKTAEETLQDKDDLLEKNAATLEEYRHEVEVIRTQLDGMNELHPEIVRIADSVQPDSSPKGAMEGLLSEMATTKQSLIERNAELDVMRMRLTAAEKHLGSVVDSTSYQLSKKIIEAGTSLSGFLRLPFAITVLMGRGFTRRLAKGRNQAHTRPLNLRAKDYIIREIKARPALERPARKALNWWRAKSGVADQTDVALPEHRSQAVAVIQGASAKAEYGKAKIKSPFASEIKVATILDEFSFGSFACEFKAIPIEPNNWKERFESEKPDIFFCESAWSGPDSVSRPWKGQVYASENFKNENRESLLNILEYCKLKNIPTVFWNKEDPTHFDDKVHNFIKTAQLFDYVFTSAAECVERYKQEYGCKNVFALPFATQPRMFNPIESVESRTKDIVFAGSWYAVHKERSQLMERVLDKFLEDGYSLKIIDRYFGTTDENHIFPERFRPYLLPPVSHQELDKVYKSSLYGLNFNTVTDSTTMFARRVFELMSSNTLVLSNYSVGVNDMFGENVIFVDREPSRLKALSDDEVDAIRERALYDVLENHTYEKRWEFILDSIGFHHRKNDNSTTLVSRIKNHDQAKATIDYFSKLESLFPDTKLLLLLSKAIADDEVAVYYQYYNRYGCTVISQSYLEKYRDPVRDIIHTANMLYVADCQFPPLSWLGTARLHLSYTGERYIGFDPDKKKYNIARLEQDKPLLSSSCGFLPLISQRNQDSWNSVFYI
ncbi:FkbM family methyltransferase [Brucella intermedia]|uniref:FkbM family methyltransferase n=1 Tax=Brucella intermedia TaxID=94625 RepID=UPI00124C8406|nr:FkbM family methyltransferase [Brucella intermedia]KAB2713839.1 FkbM family methyltransferase [Brucella intermedia]